MSANEPEQTTPTPLAVGIEIAESAMRLTLTDGDTPLAGRAHMRFPSPMTPDEAVVAIAGILAHGLRDGFRHPQPGPLMFQERPPLLPTLVALGVALADAVVDAHHGIVRRLRYAPGWDDFPLAERLAERTGAIVRLASATNAAAVAEARAGAGKGHESMLYVALGRTITSSFVIGGRYLAGAHDAEGQLGHWLVRPDGPRCACGARGHLDPIASAQSLVRNLIGRASDSDESSAAMLRVTSGRAEAMTAVQVARLAEAGDPAARAVLDDALDALAPALANLVAVLDPALIVIGGPLAAAGEGFFTPLQARLQVLCGAFSAVPDLRPGTLEPMATVLGARMIATDIGILQ